MAGRWGWVAKSKGPILRLAYPREKCGSNFATSSIRSLCVGGSGVGVVVGSGVAVGENRALYFYSIRYDSGMNFEKKELWDRLEKRPKASAWMWGMTWA